MALVRDRTRAIFPSGFRLRRAAIPDENTGVLIVWDWIIKFWSTEVTNFDPILINCWEAWLSCACQQCKNDRSAQFRKSEQCNCYSLTIDQFSLHLEFFVQHSSWKRSWCLPSFEKRWLLIIQASRSTTAWNSAKLL